MNTEVKATNIDVNALQLLPGPEGASGLRPPPCTPGEKCLSPTCVLTWHVVTTGVG
jgi:hypothetical protein